MYEVHWIGHGQDNVHGTFPTLKEAQQSVMDWWKDNNYEPPYVRQWTHENVTIWDYGSHTCYYHFVEI